MPIGEVAISPENYLGQLWPGHLCPCAQGREGVGKLNSFREIVGSF